MIDTFDLCVVGAGPAGLSLAAACQDRGLRVTLVGPGPTRPWSHNYGLWLDDVERFGLLEHVAARWDRSEVVLHGASVELGRGYVRLDNASLQASLLGRRELGLIVRDDRVVAIEHHDDRSAVVLAGGDSIAARLVVDASGHDSRFVAREPGVEPGLQVAWGELHRASPVELSGTRGVMRFMDWTPSAIAGADELPPSFLYCMPMAEGVFVEETVLVGRPLGGDPSAWFEGLRDRLHARLPSLIGMGEPVAIERCVIPMGVPLPRAGQRTLAFGGAAGFVHPATGYMLGVVLHRLARVADAIAAVVAAELAPAAACARVERAIWTPGERRAWQLFGFGMEVLLELDQAGIERFFAEFFALPPARWRGFLAGSDAPSSLMATMLRYYALATPPIRRRLTAHLLGRDGLRLARGMF